VAYSSTHFLRVGTTTEDDGTSRIWFTWSFSGDRRKLQVGGNDYVIPAHVRATTPCVAAGANNKFVAVWMEYNYNTKRSELMCARLTPPPGGAVSLHKLEPFGPQSTLRAPNYHVRHGTDAGPFLPWPRITHGATDHVVPPSVACFDDGSFAVSYSDETDNGTKHRYVQLYNALAQTIDPNPIVMDTGGWYRFNHCLVARGPTIQDPTARLMFVGVYRPHGQPWAPYFRTMMPAFSTKAAGCWYKIPMEPAHQTDLALGPAFAHPAAIRPDGKMVVTWSRQTLDGNSNPTGTVVGFSIMETAGTFAPADVDGDGLVTSSDMAAFTALYAMNDPRADWNKDGVVNATDLPAFQQDFLLGAR
jgi:hypothetical protein